MSAICPEAMPAAEDQVCKNQQEFHNQARRAIWMVAQTLAMAIHLMSLPILGSYRHLRVITTQATHSLNDPMQAFRRRFGCLQPQLHRLHLGRMAR